jgi:hypothetical protein
MPYKQAPKSAALKALIGEQKNLPEALKAKILAAPESAAKQTSDPKKNAELKRLKEIAKARKARNAEEKKAPKPKKQTKAQALVGKLKQLGSGESTGIGTGRKI